MSNTPLTAKAAATEIISLINSQPHSPRLDELEAIIGRVAAPPNREGAQDFASHPALRQWDELVRRYTAECEAPEHQGDKAQNAVLDRLCEGCEAILAQPVRDLGDVMARVAIAIHWNSDLEAPPYPTWALPRPSDGGAFDERSLAHVVQALLDLTQIRFGDEGELLTGEARHG